MAPRPLRSARTWVMLNQLVTGWRRTSERTRALVARTGADLVHLNSMPLAPSAAALAAARIPHVWHVREPPLPARGPRYAMIRRIMMRADALIFISEADRLAWVGRAPAEVVRNFVDLERFHPGVRGDAVRRTFDIPADAPLILYLGGLSEAKGILPLAEALGRVRARAPAVRILMAGIEQGNGAGTSIGLRRAARKLAGSRTIAEQFEARVRALGIDDMIVSAPFVNEVAPLIAAADVVVFPATRPHFARPAIEAAAMGKPVVASRFPVMEELVHDGRTGILVPPGAPTELADALLRMLTDRNLAARMGREGRAIALERYDAGRQIEKIMRVYDRVLSAA